MLLRSRRGPSEEDPFQLSTALSPIRKLQSIADRNGNWEGLVVATVGILAHDDFCPGLLSDRIEVLPIDPNQASTMTIFRQKVEVHFPAQHRIGITITPTDFLIGDEKRFMRLPANIRARVHVGILRSQLQQFLDGRYAGIERPSHMDYLQK